MNICPNCGKELTGIKRHNKYCDTNCQKEYEQKQYIERWQEGKENGLSGQYQISHYVRNFMLQKANYHCEKCGWGEKNPFTDKIPLEIHHKDGNYSHTIEDNLEVLCPNCHALTENFRSRGGGREDRKKYYMTNVCIDCGTTIANTSVRCKACELKHRKEENLKNLPISREDLKRRIRTESFESIARDFNMTGNGIKRWITNYGLPNTKTAINQYNEEEWEAL